MKAVARKCYSRNTQAHARVKQVSNLAMTLSESRIQPGRKTGVGSHTIAMRLKKWIELKSLILAQIERWRHALHMQVERQRGGNPGGERRTGE